MTSAFSDGAAAGAKRQPAMHRLPSTVRVIDSHTEGEATRVVIEGWPQPLGGSMAERRAFMRESQDALRRAVIFEPRGYPAMVGALLTPPVSAGASAGVIFFNNIGYLGMCGHGLMGVARTLQFMKKAGEGEIAIDTPVGRVSALLKADGAIEIENVASFCHSIGVTVQVPELGPVTGDIAYGGNWFFVSEIPGLDLRLEDARSLLDITQAIATALRQSGITGSEGAEIDHIELSAPPLRIDADCRNFVLCPGGEYDRSPCGTGTSAKLASLHARGAILIGEEFRQESITGSLFVARLTERDGELVPRIRGRAFITAESLLRFDDADPFRGGLDAP